MILPKAFKAKYIKGLSLFYFVLLFLDKTIFVPDASMNNATGIVKLDISTPKIV